MAVTLKYIGSSAQDLYYRDFKGNTGFFELDDFIFRAGVTVAEFYQKLYEQKYQELRQERTQKDELVGIDPDLLSVQELAVKDNEAVIEFPVMSFLYDQSSTGYQFVMPVNPKGVKLERCSMAEIWQFDYLPTSNRILWLPQNGKLKFKTTGNCNIQAVELYYIPSVMSKEGKVFGDTMIADGVANIAINQTVATMRQIEAKVVKESLDGNSNATLETEINKQALK